MIFTAKETRKRERDTKARNLKGKERNKSPSVMPPLRGDCGDELAEMAGSPGISPVVRPAYQAALP
jgi:hypothetical protein